MTDSVNEVKSVSEDIDEMAYEVMTSPFYAMTFSDLEGADKSNDVIDDLSNLIGVSQMMLYNIRDFSPDKIGKAKQLIDEFYKLAGTIISGDADEEKRPGLLDKLKEFISKGRKPKPELKKEDYKVDIDENSSLMIWKDKSGDYRWFARYSNNFQDRDSDIISKESHKRFVEMVDNGQAPYPELWHWHIPGSKWGQSDWIEYDEDNGIAMASGYVLKGHEKEAEDFSRMKEVVGVSHSMPGNSIKRDSSDKRVIVNHITKEISDLPLWAAANELTNFSIIKENEMGISDKKKEYLKKFLPDEQIAEIEAANELASKSAKENGIESKEANQVTEPVEETKNEESVPEPVIETPDTSKEQVQFVTPDQLSEIVKQLTDSIADVLKGLRSDMDELKAEHIEVKKETEEVFSRVPMASIAAQISKSFSAIGSKDTAVRKNSELNNGPEETPAQEQTIVRSENPIVDQVITRMLGRS